MCSSDLLEEKQPEQPQKPVRHKLTAVEARKTYGIRTAVTLALWCWFAYDAWVNKDPEMQKHKAFNTVGAVVLIFFLLYFVAMFISAALTVSREQKQQSGK